MCVRTATPIRMQAASMADGAARINSRIRADETSNEQKNAVNS